MIVVLGGIKGGSGKTTLCTNLAVMRAKDRKKVCLIDADDQESTNDWMRMREQCEQDKLFAFLKFPGKEIWKQAPVLCDFYQDIFIDVGGRDTTTQRSAMCIADIYITPFQPRSLDIWTLTNLSALVEDVKKVNPGIKCYAILNRADSKGFDNDEAIKIIKEYPEFKYIPHQIKQRKAFSNASAEGLAVVEMQDGDPKACAEIEALYQYIFNTKKV